MLMNKTLDDTFSSCKRFLLPYENEDLSFHEGRRKDVCSVSRAEAWQGTCYPPQARSAWLPWSWANPFLPAHRGSGWGRADAEPDSCSSPLHIAIYRGWSDVLALKLYLQNGIGTGKLPWVYLFIPNVCLGSPKILLKPHIATKMKAIRTHGEYKGHIKVKTKDSKYLYDTHVNKQLAYTEKDNHKKA